MASVANVWVVPFGDCLLVIVAGAESGHLILVPSERARVEVRSTFRGDQRPPGLDDVYPFKEKGVGPLVLNFPPLFGHVAENTLKLFAVGGESKRGQFLRQFIETTLGKAREPNTLTMAAIGNAQQGGIELLHALGSDGVEHAALAYSKGSALKALSDLRIMLGEKSGWATEFEEDVQTREYLPDSTNRDPALVWLSGSLAQAVYLMMQIIYYRLTDDQAARYPVQ